MTQLKLENTITIINARIYLKTIILIKGITCRSMWISMNVYKNEWFRSSSLLFHLLRVLCSNELSSIFAVVSQHLNNLRWTYLNRINFTIGECEHNLSNWLPIFSASSIGVPLNRLTASWFTPYSRRRLTICSWPKTSQKYVLRKYPERNQLNSLLFKKINKNHFQ